MVHHFVEGKGNYLMYATKLRTVKDLLVHSYCDPLEGTVEVWRSLCESCLSVIFN